VILIREKLYREANRELVRERNRRHYRKNRLAVLMKQRVWYEQNREIHAERVRRWGQNNREKRLSYTHRRRVRRLQNGGSYTKREWYELKRRFDFTCLCCGQKEPAIKLTVDHVIPISRGGTNDIGNIQPLCRRCNQSKGTQTIDYRERIINECVGSIRD
jgi:5-methylcytosine-specific restriction endonuclease McrA